MDEQPFRPALSPPAEGSSDSGLWTEDMEWERRWGDYERGFRDGQKGIVAVDLVKDALANLKRFSGPDPKAQIEAAKDDLTSALKSTPTPAPVDWERVGPKLVEALEGVLAWDKARGYTVPYRVRDPIHAAMIDATGVSIASPTTPQSNGE